MPNARRQLQSILGLTKSKETYENISSDINAILASNETERAEKLREYYFRLFDSVYSSGLQYRLSEEVKPTFMGFFTDFNKIDGKSIRDRLGEALKQMVTEKNPELGQSIDKYLGTTLEQRMDMVLNTGKKLTQMQALVKAGTEKSISRLNEVSSGILKSMAGRKGEKYAPNVNTLFNKNIEELYVLYSARKDAFRTYLDGRSGFWKFLHSREISKTEKFFKDSESVFAQSGFDRDKHLDDVVKRLESTPCEFVGFQIDMAKDEYKQKKEELETAEKLKKVNQLSAAADKLKNALELDKVKETSFETKMQPYIEKYNIEVGPYGLPMYHIAYEGAAEAFDTLRDLDAVKSSINQRFISIFGFVTGGYLKKHGTVDPAEIIKASQEILEMDLKHYTVVYEHPEAKSIADSNICGTIETSVLQRKMLMSVRSYHRKNNIPLTEESENAIKEAVENTVNELREAQKKAVEERDKQTENVVDKDQTNPNRQPFRLEIKGDISNGEFVPKIDEEEKVISSNEIKI